ncbi:MAG: FtsX-like permease family protein, partial [Terriglobales bacterium]
PKHERISEKSDSEMFVPITQNPWPPMNDMALVVRVHPASDGQLPANLRNEVAAAVHAVDPDVPLAQWKPLQQLVDSAVAPARFALVLLTSFALLTLLLAAIGLYGVVALMAGQRQRELGVRLALGATRGSLFGLVLRQGALLAAAGIAAGWFLALLGAGVLRSYLFGVGAFDPLTLTLAPLLLAAVALAACLLPARRAARLDVLAALRQD